MEKVKIRLYFMEDMVHGLFDDYLEYAATAYLEATSEGKTWIIEFANAKDAYAFGYAWREYQVGRKFMPAIENGID